MMKPKRLGKPMGKPASPPMGAGGPAMPGKAGGAIASKGPATKGFFGHKSEAAKPLTTDRGMFKIK